VPGWAKARRAVAVALGVAVAACSAEGAIVDHLLAWWEFDQIGAGHSIADLSGNNRSLTLFENPYLTNPAYPPAARPTLVAGGVGGGTALHQAVVNSPDPYGLGRPFPAPTGFAAFPDANPGALDSSDAVDFSGSTIGYSIQAWIKLRQNEEHQVILSNRGGPRDGVGADLSRSGWDLILYGTEGITGRSNRLELQGYTNGVGSHQVETGAVAVNSWHQIMVTYSATTGIHMYFDGVDLVSLPFNTSIATFQLTPGNLLLGTEAARAWGQNPFLGMPLQGDMDKVALWDRALTAGEVTALYNSGNGYDLSVPDNARSAGTLVLVLLGLTTLRCLRRRR
jgi:hypothetical protein